MRDVTMRWMRVPWARACALALAGFLLSSAGVLPGGVAPAAAQSEAAVEGRVTESESGAPMGAVTVRVLGTDRSTLTNADGRFRISRLQPGVRSLAFEALGYQPRVVEVTVTAGATERLQVAMESAPLAVEGLVVTSQKRQQAVQEVPITITVFDGDFLETTGIQEFDRLSAYTPGLEVQIQSPNNPGFVVRGITSDNGDSRVQPRVSVFQDGVSISKARGSVVELFDLERVEVLKGPQGTLFGRAAQIGAVHLIQNKARNERSGELTAGPGNYGGLFASGYANTPLVEDRLFGRVAGVYSTRDGYVENLGGEDLNGKETVALRGLLRWMPGEFTDVDLIVNWQHDTPPGTAFKSGVFAPSATVSTDPTEPVNMGGSGPFEAPFVDRTVWGATLLADHVLSPAWTVQTVGAFRTFDSYESFDADGTIAPALQFAEEANGDQYSVELRALFNSGGRLSGFGGVSAFHEDGSQGVIFRTSEQALYPLLTRVIHVEAEAAGIAFPEEPLVVNGQPNLVTALPENLPDLAPFLNPDNPDVARLLLQSYVGTPLRPYWEERVTNYGTTTSYEAFVDGTFTVTERLEVTAGVRGSLEQVTAGLQVPEATEASLLGQVTGSFPNIIFPATARSGSLIEHEETFLSWVGRLAADYEVHDDLNLYATLGRGRRPQVIQEFEGNPIANFEVLDEEIVWSYEAGAKGLVVDGRLQYDVAAFYYDYQDFQTNRQGQLTSSGIIFQTDLGQATAFGSEVALMGRVSEGLSVFGNYAFIDASFDELSRTGEPQQLAGNTFRLTPKHSFSAGFGLTGELAGATLFVRPNYTWKSRVYFEEEHQEETFGGGLAPGLYQDGYGLLNVRAGADLLDGRASVELWANNLFDEEYIIDAGNTGINFFAPTYIPGPPLLFGIRVTGRL